jgi:hypothetical protein
MNTLAAASLVLAAALAATFSMPVVAVAPVSSGHAVLVVSCSPGARPSQRDVAALLGTNNGHEIYEGRDRLMTQVRSACRKAGIERVAITGRGMSARVAVATAAASRPIADN